MRIKRGKTKKAKHNKILKLTKGYRLSYSKLVKRAKEARLHAGQYSFAHRKKRKGQFRRLWIQRINAALSTEKMKYSTFIGNLKKANIELDRKILSELAFEYPETFKAIVKKVK
ncbi:50S ribosomal protein L20 [Candidatus Dojkabacteria bacterium]|nr:50S ribosomal protein L20 [Candidatus Dojkabacteria bacterium]